MTQSSIRRLPFAFTPASLAWDGDDLVDWVGGGGRRYAHSFDRALVSPSGRYSVIYAERQTKGLVLDRGEILREIDRSYYQADSFAYPAAVGQLPDGREVLAHCPDEYNVIQLEDLVTGKRLTRRRGKAEDIFHSRLCFSPDGSHLLSAGWLWHPWNVVCVFDVAEALENPRSLDRARSSPAMLQTAVMGGEVRAACWLDSQRLLITTDTQVPICDEGASDKAGLPQGYSGIWSVTEQRWLSRDPAWNPQGSLYACGGGALYVEGGCPHWWAPEGGAPLVWPEIKVLQPDEAPRSGIVFDSPLLAAHPTERRFAAVTSTGIVTVDFA